LDESPTTDLLRGQRIALVGKLAGMSKRDAQHLVRQNGGVVVERPDASVDLVVCGEEELLDEGLLEEGFDQLLRQAIDRGSVELIGETQLWQRLGLVEPEHSVHRLYTPAMLADLLGVSVAIIRRWHRRGLIVPAREVRKLPYFDFQEVSTARRLAELLAAGASAPAIEKKLAALARFLPGVQRPLAQLSVIVEGQQLLLRQGDGLVETGGQLRLDFDAPAEDDDAASSLVKLALPQKTVPVAGGTEELDTPNTPQEMVRMAADLEDDGQLEAAAEAYRAAMVAGGPSAEICFQLAELLYRLEDVSAARERYYMAIELDEDYVEARANLGCVLAETGQPELAVAAFEGALSFHDDYPDVHYHLARTLDQLGRSLEALTHWEAFYNLAPDSPWAEEARARLEKQPIHRDDGSEPPTDD
jgi:tetratricopeptide (TPR) repeat protein